MEPIVLVGGGGHCKAVIDIIEAGNEFEIHGILDLPEKVGGNVLGYEIIGSNDDISSLAAKGMSFLVTVGQIKDPTPRVKLFQIIENVNGKIATVISPFAKVTRSTLIGKGTIVMHNCIVNSGANIGMNTIINSGALIEHECRVGNHCHISTHAVLNGGAKVDDCCFIGSNATVIEGISIGKNSIIGACSLVNHDLKHGTLAVGIPGRTL